MPDAGSCKGNWLETSPIGVFAGKMLFDVIRAVSEPEVGPLICLAFSVKEDNIVNGSISLG
jgi:hypothetical protein